MNSAYKLFIGVVKKGIQKFEIIDDIAMYFSENYYAVKQILEVAEIAGENADDAEIDDNDIEV